MATNDNIIFLRYTRMSFYNLQNIKTKTVNPLTELYFTASCSNI